MLINKSLLISLGVISYIVVGVFAYYKGYTEASNEYKNRLAELQTNNLQAILNQERKYKDKENEIIKNYSERMDLLKQEYEKMLIVSNNLRDTFVPECLQHTDTSSTRVSQETKPKSNTRCYTESDLLRKVKESVAIGNECDQLAIRYNSLLEWCKQ